MSELMIQSIKSKYQEAVYQFFTHHWGSEEMILTTGIYHVSQLPGFIAIDGSRIIGLATYTSHADSLELISLNSTVEKIGIASYSFM